MFAVVIGCGRVGSTVATTLSTAGHSVVAVDRSQEALDNLPAEYSGFRLLGNGAERAIMERARMSDADVVVAATDDDNQNGLIALAARLVYSVARVVVRVQNPGRVELLESYGITVVSPPELAAQRVVEAISTDDRERAEVD